MARCSFDWGYGDGPCPEAGECNECGRCSECCQDHSGWECNYCGVSGWGDISYHRCNDETSKSYLVNTYGIRSMNCCKCGGDMKDAIEAGDYVTCEYCGGPFHLSEWDGEDFNCGCTTLSAESSKGSVRTMSGKSHRPRPLVKDRNLSPREARTRKQVRGESFGGKISLPDGETMTGFYFSPPQEGQDPMAQDGVIVFWPSDSTSEPRVREALREQGWSWTHGERAPEPHWQYPPYGFFRLSGVTVEDINNFILKYNLWVDHNPGTWGRRKIPYPWNGVFSTYGIRRRQDVPYFPQVAQYYDMMAENFEAEKGKERVVESKEESGITTKTVQREDKSYDVDKMRASIPKQYRNQVDEDDRFVGAIGVVLGVVAATAYQRFKTWWSSRDQ